ncbi:hypothetical protein PGUG_00643 [Meyerozyma guilliermondii ATCC 6260]|uniref:FYVE-type domain-containing protein n=1 Tax=Meyerozyma guilliermondii (strain ATCC 6260 / CBS 566 / DSM 6381 / JCM 1539 / NBRC 10279 / NRRL Y-324) TaxID=294746 RepID=A5DBI8_PICGU|nr:uncharacterized protein PGUG_00643 [Meyerozyma guilliermondii ATCC 6260]EDK36545.2 hypothetical protein PGUG_00643 [Meyerozyma guilliermondii ATCC 6260]
MSDELPPFSFSKKPIESPAHPHSAISDIIPKPSSSPFVVQDEKSEPKAAPPDIFEAVDFDQQIRAPRMTLSTHYTYGNSQKLPSITSKNSLEEGEKPPDVSQKQYQKEYLPASFDLSQPTRRFSAPSDLDLPESPSKTMLNYTINNNMYDNHRTQEQQALIRALENLSSNATTQERQPERGPVVQQLYKQKKPMSVPAVLRANDSSSSSRSSPPSPYLQFKSYPFPEVCQSPATSDGDNSPKNAAEPTHMHWKPNSYASYCIKCFDTFGTFFTPQRKRRHHCRFCGFIFCYNCLYTSSSDDSKRVYLDKLARFVIPIGQDADASQFKACKVCKDCGSNYAKLVAAASTSITTKDNNLTHIFVENPYTASPQESPIPMPQPAAQRQSSEPSPDNRRPSNGVPSDWTWSSF